MDDNNYTVDNESPFDSIFDDNRILSSSDSFREQEDYQAMLREMDEFGERMQQMRERHYRQDEIEGVPGNGIIYLNILLLLVLAYVVRELIYWLLS